MKKLWTRLVKGLRQPSGAQSLTCAALRRAPSAA
jgi:hypothetical protein